MLLEMSIAFQFSVLTVRNFPKIFFGTFLLYYPLQFGLDLLFFPELTLLQKISVFYNVPKKIKLCLTKSSLTGHYQLFSR